MGRFLEQFYNSPIRDQKKRAPKWRDGAQVFVGMRGRIPEIPLAVQQGFGNKGSGSSGAHAGTSVSTATATSSGGA